MPCKPASEIGWRGVDFPLICAASPTWKGNCHATARFRHLHRSLRSLTLLTRATLAAFAVPLAAEVLSTEQPSPQEMAEELGISLPGLPWHLANVWWNLESEVGNSESLRVAVTFGWPEINGQPAAVSSAIAHFPNQATQAGPDAATIIADGPNARFEVGPIFERPEEQRTHPLELTPPDTADADSQ